MDIAAGRASAAERMACIHLAATQTMLLSRFDDGIVNASSNIACQAVKSGHAIRP